MGTLFSVPNCTTTCKQSAVLGLAPLPCPLQEWAVRTLQRKRLPGDPSHLPDLHSAVKQLMAAHRFFHQLLGLGRGVGLDERKLERHINFIAETHNKALVRVSASALPENHDCSCASPSPPMPCLALVNRGLVLLRFTKQEVCILCSHLSAGASPDGRRGRAEGEAAPGGCHGRSRCATGAGRLVWAGGLRRRLAPFAPTPLYAQSGRLSAFHCCRSCGCLLRASGGQRRRRGGDSWTSRPATTRSACASCRTSGAPARPCRRCAVTPSLQRSR